MPHPTPHKSTQVVHGLGIPIQVLQLQSTRPIRPYKTTVPDSGAGGKTISKLVYEGGRIWRDEVPTTN